MIIPPRIDFTPHHLRFFLKALLQRNVGLPVADHPWNIYRGVANKSNPHISIMGKRLFINTLRNLSPTYLPFLQKRNHLLLFCSLWGNMPALAVRTSSTE